MATSQTREYEPTDAGTQARPEGTRELRKGVNPISNPNPDAAAAIVAGVFAEQMTRARASGDEEATAEWEAATEEMEAAAGGVGAPSPVFNPDEPDIGLPATPGAPAPLIPRSSPAYEEQRVAAPPAQQDEEPGEEVEAADETAAATPSLEASLPPDILALISQDEDEEDEEEEDEGEQEKDELYGPVGGQEEEFVPEGYEDEEKLRLRKQVAKLQKKVEFVERKKAKTERQGWLGEGTYPAVPPARAAAFAGQAKSRTDYHRLMKAENDLYKEHLTGKFMPAAATTAEEARAEAKAEAAQAWGQPVAGANVPGAYTPGSPEWDSQRNIDIARNRGGLGGYFTELIRQGIQPGRRS